jgi:hypothetical protein
VVSFISRKGPSERFSFPVERGSILLQMVEVPHVVAFTVTIGSQLIAFGTSLILRKDSSSDCMSSLITAEEIANFVQLDGS